MTWPEKAELAATIQQMLKTVPVGMFAMARDAVDEICLFDARGVRYTITPPIYGLSREYYTVIEWGEGRLSNSRQTHLLPSRWELLTWIAQTRYYLRKGKAHEDATHQHADDYLGFARSCPRH